MHLPQLMNPGQAQSSLTGESAGIRRGQPAAAGDPVGHGLSHQILQHHDVEILQLEPLIELGHEWAADPAGPSHLRQGGFPGLGAERARSPGRI